MITWEKIDTVLLDMDGTLLDLHFDNYFWQHHVPQRFADKHGLSVDDAKAAVYPRFRAAEGTLNWYCVDHWTRELELDIAILKEEVEHLIAVHPHVLDFLTAVRAEGKRLVLVTNAHGKAVALKFRKTRLGDHFDAIVCAHDLGLAKEHSPFWAKMHAIEPFDPQRTLLIDDSLPVLRCAHEHGIAHLLAVKNPDSKGPTKDTGEFPAIETFLDIMPAG